MRLKSIRTFATELYHAWNEDKPTRLAAALAYYGLFSLAPLLFIAFKVAEMFIGELLTAEQFFARLENSLGQETAQYLRDLVINVSESTSLGVNLASLIGFAALLYAASGLFTNVQYALNMIWKAPPPAGSGIVAFIRNRLLAFGLVIGVGLILITASAASFAFSLLDSFLDLGGTMPIANVASLLGLTTLSFAVLYRVLPNVDIAWRDVWVGAAVAALMFGVGGWLLGFYLAHSDITSAFGAASAVAVLLVVMYYFAQIFLFGAIFTKVYASVFRSRDVSVPSDDD